MDVWTRRRVFGAKGVGANSRSRLGGGVWRAEAADRVRGGEDLRVWEGAESTTTRRIGLDCYLIGGVKQKIGGWHWVRGRERARITIPFLRLHFLIILIV